jgi:hypothetical protein
LNLIGWCFSFYLLRKKKHPDAETRAARYMLLWLSAAYVLGCAFRSVFPMVDVPRICLHDTWISRIAVGRSIATVAELCFAVQWALLLREASGGTGFAGRAGRLVVPLIVLAELSCWSAVLTSNYLLHALENSLWAVAAALGLAGFGSLHTRLALAGRRFLYAAAVFGGAYLAFMAFVDVPMYLERWVDAAAAGPRAGEGVRSALERCVVNRDWLAWREDALWLTLYFTAAVWASIALPHAPFLGPRR